MLTHFCIYFDSGRTEGFNDVRFKSFCFIATTISSLTIAKLFQILFAAALAYSVECFEEPEHPESVEEEDQDGELQPRFLAVFLETEGGAWNDSDSETGTKVNLTGHAVNDVLPRIHNGSLSRMTNILGNLSAVNKFESVLEKLGYENSTSETGDGSTSEETTKFKNILTTLENSNLSNKTLAKVEEILGKIESGDGFAMYRV